LIITLAKSGTVNVRRLRSERGTLFQGGEDRLGRDKENEELSRFGKSAKLGIAGHSPKLRVIGINGEDLACIATLFEILKD
jgi:hypothetical protein